VEKDALLPQMYMNLISANLENTNLNAVLAIN
jgi:hypothetical protein